MWLLGLIVGGFIGAVGGLGGALLGAAVGLAVGISSSKKPPAGDAKWQQDVDQALAQLHRRIEALERGAAPGAAQAGLVPAAAAQPEPDPRPQPQSEQTAHTAVGVAAPARPPTEEAAIVPGAQLAREASSPAAARVSSDNPLTRWLFGGNTLVRVGVVVLFFGVAFLLKFAADHGLVPIELRLTGVALGGIALLVVGWRLRTKRAGYALMLQGAGVGVLYLTVFAALRLYRLLPPEPAFGLLAVIAIFSAAVAVLQNSRSLAITGAAGGFLAPILASTGSGNHVALFSFYAVLNAGILGIAYYKAWRELNLVGFAFTFVIGLLWGAKYYRPELFTTTEPFLILFFLFYVAIAVLFARRQAPRLAHYVDGTLVFGTPLIAFGLQTALVRLMEFGAAWSAFAVSAFYLGLASVLHARGKEILRLLVESFLALGIGFATLAVPLAFDGRWTSAVWAVEGAAILWVGVRQGRVLPRVFAMLLQLAGGAAFVVGADRPYGAAPVLNSFYLGCVMVSGAGLFCSYYVERNRHRVSQVELIASRLLFAWGALWWFGGGLVEIDRQVPVEWGRHPHLVFFAASCAAFGGLWRRLDWNMARYAALSILPWMALTALILVLGVSWHRHPFAHHAYLGWGLGFAVHLWLLRAHESGGASWPGRFHAAGFWLLAFILSWEAGWQIDRYVDGQRVWPLIAWALVPGAFIALFAGGGDRLGWPVSAHRRAYLYTGALPLAAFLVGWMLWANFASNGDPAPLPYVPLINPLDIAQAGALLALVAWYLAVKRLDMPGVWLPSPPAALTVLGVVSFIALNGVLLRTLHHYADVPFRLDAMWRSMLVQAAFSLFWSLLALAAMIVATRRVLRPLWVVGATLLGVVVAKLFLVDLANTGTVERVVSFISVGVLVIVVGYFAPVPPRPQEKTA